MPHRYCVVIALDALEALPRGGKRRKFILNFLKQLCENPYDGGDFQIIDPVSERMLEVSIVKGFSVIWWVDAPVSEVKVVEIRMAK